MSIINEALKKTEQYIRKNEAKHNPPAKAIPAAKPPLLLYALILIAGILLSKFIFDLISQPAGSGLASNSQSHQPAGSASLQEKKEIIEPPPAPISPEPTKPQETKETPQPELVLNGIFFSDSDGYALVNNQIVRENDPVDGAIVTRITANSVELDYNGKFISLSTHR